MLPMIKCQANGWWPPGCGLISQTQDAATQTITNMFAGILESMASWMWSFISGAFGVSDLGPSDWTAVSGVTNWWIVVMMTPLVVVMILQLLSGMISQQPRRIVRAVIAGGIAVPVVIGAVSLMQKLTQFTDSASSAVLQTLGSDPYVVFMRLFGFTRAPAGSGHEWDLISMTSPGTSGPTGPIIVTVVAVALVWVLAFVLMCSMIFRSFALLVLAATAPVALMLMPWEHTMSWTRRWCETVVALLIAKPLAATVLAVAVKLFANSTSFAGLASGAVGMLLAWAAPLMALRLVSFAGGELAGAAQVAGGGHVLSRSGSFAARQISRQAGGKLSLSSLGSQKPTLVPSSAEPTVKSGAEPNLKQLQKVGKVSGQQNMKNDGGQPVPSGGSQPPGSETKTYGQPYIKRAGTPHRDPTTPTPSRQPRSDSGPLTTPVSAVSEPSPSKQNGVAAGGQRAGTPVPRPVAPASTAAEAPKPHPPAAPLSAPQAPPAPRPPRINPEREKDV
ncbi:type IV secretion system protein [Arthrobacter antibioticus]|uniref:type IV secretion system protein n=1 Tax=Arthrobacter sp. H35-MC1 TaxID=3046203 RepID=UPI0024B8C8EE|nr:type IV secretion system protein [Arthrobacter sp. H35-MC1]MDJ0318397.1 type IV secretion system protein [Arthrobacter sp. H35-MC1]